MSETNDANEGQGNDESKDVDPELRTPMDTALASVRRCQGIARKAGERRLLALLKRNEAALLVLSAEMDEQGELFAPAETFRA